MTTNLRTWKRNAIVHWYLVFVVLETHYVGVQVLAGPMQVHQLLPVLLDPVAENPLPLLQLPDHQLRLGHMLRSTHR